ncbi:MAG: GNAT family N-acetyltransferase [Anaerolineales bacterium]|nr:GNAT family N-acetyltransferase [Anaerolineales bacterium]MCZ2121360.1 GNAT family N-acetyltransferase [Anaerolineales bacterium]
MQIEIAVQADDELYEAFQRLVPQLTHNNPPPALDFLRILLREDSSTLLVARDESRRIVGALNLTVYRVPTGIRSIIEDVIVDQSARGQGIGEALMQRAIEIAKEKGASNIALTSNPMRTAANRLYLRMGFQKRETNAYQLKL